MSCLILMYVKKENYICIPKLSLKSNCVFHNLLSWQVNVEHLTSLYLDPLCLHRGHIKPLFGVDLPDVIASSQGPQRVPGALIPSGWSNRSLVFCNGGSEPEDI